MNRALLASVGPDTAKKLGLSADEFDQIVSILGRQPNFNEVSIFSVMWSEHCSYKNSILQLKKLPKDGARVLAAAGEENAGLLDIGDGLGVAFKVESHNHPSAIEPFQGAATGVGGIHRDIFTMGARPIASLNSLRFGDPSNPKTRHILKGVVHGIGSYGNAFGVPTVGGEVFFDPCYHTNPLVNAMSVGIVKAGETASAVAKGVGNPVFIVGSATGKDGIHGATFASEDITAASADKLPSVQVGDPFTEKLLLEATLEVIATGAVVGMQDMGAAGITCSTSETAAKGECGMDVWLHKAPLRQADMEPFEILLSESQERMLIICEKGREAELLAIYDKWDLPCAEIGVVTEGGSLRYFWHDELVAEVPAECLVLGGGAPRYVREQKEPEYLKAIAAFDAAKVPDVDNPTKVVEFLLKQPNIASKRWIRRQYDSMVGVGTMTSGEPSAAAVVHIKGTGKALALTTDCNPRYVRANPRVGAALAVAEAARNVVCSGGLPLGITNCLNFGNPFNPEVYWQFAGAIDGMGEACRAFGLPVTGGNVSFYNQSSDDGPVFPTPTIGLVGLLDDAASQRMSLHFRQSGDTLFLLGRQTDDIGCSEYLTHYVGVADSPAPYLNLAEERTLQQLLLDLIGAKLIQSANDVSDGGLLVTLLESAFPVGLGFSINTLKGIRKDAFLFGEGGGRVVVSVKLDKLVEFLSVVKASGLPFVEIGRVDDDTCMVDDRKLGTTKHLRKLYDTALEERLGVTDVAVAV